MKSFIFLPTIAGLIALSAQAYADFSLPLSSFGFNGNCPSDIFVGERDFSNDVATIKRSTISVASLSVPGSASVEAGELSNIHSPYNVTSEVNYAAQWRSEFQSCEGDATFTSPQSSYTVRLLSKFGYFTMQVQALEAGSAFEIPSLSVYAGQFIFRERFFH
jgi:hypothetical protein